MLYKFNLGDIVFMNHLKFTANAAILHVTQREFKKIDDDLLPHKYYGGYAFGMEVDEDQSLYVPVGLKAVWSPKQRESNLEIINSNKVDVYSLLPLFKK